jgi:hypothetical protein
MMAKERDEIIFLPIHGADEISYHDKRAAGNDYDLRKEIGIKITSRLTIEIHSDGGRDWS